MIFISMCAEMGMPFEAVLKRQSGASRQSSYVLELAKAPNVLETQSLMNSDKSTFAKARPFAVGPKRPETVFVDPAGTKTQVIVGAAYSFVYGAFVSAVNTWLFLPVLLLIVGYGPSYVSRVTGDNNNNSNSNNDNSNGDNGDNYDNKHGASSNNNNNSISCHCHCFRSLCFDVVVVVAVVVVGGGLASPAPGLPVL